MNNTAWQSARIRAGLPELRVHDLRHTFATRLAAAGVLQNVIAQLLWHSSKTVAQHYMGSQILILVAAAERLANAPEKEDESLATVIAAHSKRRARGGPRNESPKVPGQKTAARKAGPPSRCFKSALMVRLAGFEPTTPWFVAKYSIQLSYSR